MRKTVHLCLSSHDEVLYRSEEDLVMGFNCLALAVLSTQSRLLAEGFMTTHHHTLIQSDNYKEVMYRSRYSYARYFNAKYRRKGLLGEKSYFCLEIEGLYHTTAALNYVLRQGLHHGISSTPFEYRHCSTNAFFRKELGKTEGPKLMPDLRRYLFLPDGKSLPADSYRMCENGLLMREDIIDVPYVEEIYVSPRNFLFQMNKGSTDKDVEDQRKENEAPPVTMGAIESGVPDFDSRESAVFELGRVDRSRMTDIELCSVIDRRMAPRYSKGDMDASIYSLPESTRAEIGEALWQESCRSRYRKDASSWLSGKFVTEAQLRRCLCLR